MPTKLRVAFDTNTTLSGILWRNSLPAQALERAFETCVLLQSEETLNELWQVAARTKFDRYSLPEERLAAVSILEQRSFLVDVHSDVKACRDDKDDKFLNLARDGLADFLVTGDQDLLSLDRFGSCRIVNAAEFLKLSMPQAC